MNSSLLGFVGSGPAEMVKRSNWPGSRPPAVAVHVIFDTASVTEPSSVFTGFGSVVFSVVIVHPVMGFTLTNAIGFLVGTVTSTETVLASSSSLGTEKLKIWNPPFGSDDGTTVTCAEATPTEISVIAATTAATTTIRIPNMGRMSFVPPVDNVLLVARETDWVPRESQVRRVSSSTRGRDVEGLHDRRRR